VKKTMFVVAVMCVAAAIASANQGRLRPDPPHACSSCDEWNAPREPFKVFGNTYYVGVGGLSSVLITSNQGHVLLDGGLTQSAASIAAHIEALGFRLQDVKLIAVSHEHFDHVGGVAALQRASGARVVAGAAAARALARGWPTADDPQYGFRPSNGFPAVKGVKTVKDGETLRVGDIAITAHRTPGHTPGSTTWTWQSCEGTRCVAVVYADSLNAVAADGFTYSARPGRVDEFRRSIATVRALPCDVLLTVHPGFARLDEKLAARQAGVDGNPFIDPSACRAYADTATATLDARLADEKARGSHSYSPGD
jgi:metallo-beta-lactamase class B